MNIKKNYLTTGVFILFASMLMGLFVNCSGNSSSPGGDGNGSQSMKGDRVLGVHISEPQNGFTPAYAAATRLNFEVVNLHFFWGSGNFAGTLPGLPLEVNTSPGCGVASTYDMSMVGAAHAFYPSRNKSAVLTIGTYDGPNKLVPTCLASIGFNSTSMKTMFKGVIDNVFATINPGPFLRLNSLIIGNEVDLHADLSMCTASPLSQNWADYKGFFDETSAYAKTLRQGLKVGITGTFAGLTSSSKAPCFSQLLANADFVSVTYYPVNADFTMKSVSQVAADMNLLVATYPGKEIRLQEVGYSSGSTFVGSSETQQADFYTAMFNAWDTHKDQIKYMSFVNLHEWSAATVDGFGAMYGVCPGVNCNAFKEFLQTLGVRTQAGDGADKPAFLKIIEEADKRGF